MLDSCRHLSGFIFAVPGAGGICRSGSTSGDMALDRLARSNP